MQIFSYIFYTFSKVYKAGLDKHDPDIYACGFLTLLQGFNIATILRYFISEDKQFLSWIISGVILFPINWSIFNQKSLEKFDERWDKEPKGQRFFRRFLVLLYVIGTFCLFFRFVIPLKTIKIIARKINIGHYKIHII